MRTVYKYVLSKGEFVDTRVTLPKGAEVLTVEMQAGRLCLWARVETDEREMVVRGVEMMGTGGPLASNWPYVGTFHPGPGMVIHAFVEPEL